MRRVLTTLVMLAALTAYAGRTARSQSLYPRASSLRARMLPPRDGELRFRVSEPAYVAVFEIVPGRFVRLLDPYAGASRLHMAGMSFEPLPLRLRRGDPVFAPYSIHRGYGYRGYDDLDRLSAGAYEADPFGYRALAEHDGRGYGGDAYEVHYLLLVASATPLLVSHYIESPAALRRAMGWRGYASPNVREAVDVLASDVLDLTPDGNWTMDLFAAAPRSYARRYALRDARFRHYGTCVGSPFSTFPWWRYPFLGWSSPVSFYGIAPVFLGPGIAHCRGVGGIHIITVRPRSGGGEPTKESADTIRVRLPTPRKPPPVAALSRTGTSIGGDGSVRVKRREIVRPALIHAEPARRERTPSERTRYEAPRLPELRRPAATSPSAPSTPRHPVTPRPRTASSRSPRPPAPRAAPPSRATPPVRVAPPSHAAPPSRVTTPSRRPTPPRRPSPPRAVKPVGHARAR